MIEIGSDDNWAMIGNRIMEREDGESVPAFRARARDTALGIGADILIFALLDPVVWVDDLPEPEPAVITIKGGLQRDASGDFATVGGLLIERSPPETVEEFRVRARAAAVAASRDHVVFGGLRPMNITDQSQGE